MQLGRGQQISTAARVLTAASVDESCDVRHEPQHRLVFKLNCNDASSSSYNGNKKLSCRRGTARCVVSVEILPVATQQCRNYLYDKS